MYEVLKSFTDDVDGGVYYAGRDTYPHEGKEPAEERIAYLMSDKNKLGAPAIKPDDGGAKPHEKMNKDELLAEAAKRGIKLGEAKNKADILAATVAAAAKE